MALSAFSLRKYEVSAAGGAGAEIGAYEIPNSIPEEGITKFSRFQRIAITSDDAFWAGVWLYSQGKWGPSLDGFGVSTLHYYLPPDEVTGLFLYNYAAGTYVDGTRIFQIMWH